MVMVKGHIIGIFMLVMSVGGTLYLAAKERSIKDLNVKVDIELVGTSATFDELALAKCAEKDGMIAFSAKDAWSGAHIIDFFCITEAK